MKINQGTLAEMIGAIRSYVIFCHGQISKGLEWQYRGPPCLVECPETRLSVTRARINDSAIGSNTVINASHVATDPIDYVVTDIFGATALDMNGDRRGPYIRFRSAGSNIARAWRRA